MTDLSYFLYLKSLPILGLGRSSRSGLFHWFGCGAYHLTEASANRFEIVTYESSELADAVDHEFGKFLFAALESSVGSLEPEDGSRIGGWSIVKRYYTAYYAAHAILRAIGKFGIYIDRQRASQIETWFDANGLPTSVEAGFYSADISSHGNLHSIALSKVNVGSKGNHELFWHYFRKCLNDLVEDVVGSGEINSKLLVSRWAEIEKILSYLGRVDGNWLSQMRNDVSYQLAHGLWYPSAPPFSDSIPINMRLQKNEAIRLDIDVRKKALAAFSAACAVMFSSAYDTGARLAATRAQSAFAKDLNKLRGLLNIHW